MRLTSFSLITSAVLLSATVAQAAGHETMQAPAPTVEQAIAAPTAPVAGTYVVLGILAALLIAAASGNGTVQKVLAD